MENLIQVERAVKEYTTGDSSVYALNDVSFKIDRGEFVAIIGASGSGKSTLMNMLGCLDSPTSGTYMLEGVNVNMQSDDEISTIRNRKIGFIFQGFNLIQSLNAIENVELPLIYRGIKKCDRRELSIEALCRVGLESRLRHLPSQMSGGQQQRVAIARAIAARPPILLADEPTGNLDKKSGEDVMSILMELNKEGKTIILITHDPAIAALADRTIKMSDGALCG